MADAAAGVTPSSRRRTGQRRGPATGPAVRRRCGRDTSKLIFTLSTNTCWLGWFGFCMSPRRHNMLMSSLEATIFGPMSLDPLKTFFPVASHTQTAGKGVLDKYCNVPLHGTIDLFGLAPGRPDAHTYCLPMRLTRSLCMRQETALASHFPGCMWPMEGTCGPRLCPPTLPVQAP